MVSPIERAPAGACRSPTQRLTLWRSPCAIRQQQQHRRRRAGGARAAAGGGSDPSLLTLPVFPLANVLHPTQEGVLRVFEPRFVALFRDLLAEAPGGKGARFVHVLAPRAAPPALLEHAVGGLPRVACCAEVDAIQEHGDGTMSVTYSGTRRLRLLLVQREQPYVVAAAEWYDDGEAGELDPTVDVLEQEAARLLQQIERLSALVAPGSELPEAVRRHAPPAVQRRTSYDTLKAAGHAAAGHIDTWRRHGSVYKPAARRSASAADPDAAVREALGKARRQELFSFAAAQLLDMGLAERSALLLSQDTGARLNFVLTALRPFLLELQAKAALKRGLE